MEDPEFTAWLSALRYELLRQWNEEGVPPRTGLTTYDMERVWNAVVNTPTDKMWRTADDGSMTLFGPSSSSASGVISQWFPTMMKTRINKSETDGSGSSIYDIFNDDATWARYMKTYAMRHFRYDSFFSYTDPVDKTEPGPTTNIVAKSAEEFMQILRDKPSHTIALFGDEPESFGCFFAPSLKEEEATAHTEKVPDSKLWTFTAAELQSLLDSGNYPREWFRGLISAKRVNKRAHWVMRTYSSSTRILPGGYKAFRLSLTQYAVNFPALAARALYEKFTEGISNPIIYDPSAGWGGRLVGAITMPKECKYIACDPNSDHVWTDESGIVHSKYTEIAAFHRDRLPLGATTPDVEFYPVGSEVIHTDANFQRYRGKVDFAFTSPPYFVREMYSLDPTQSARKFPVFDEWCEGFLKPTIMTAAEWLRPGGTLAWNVADVKVGQDKYLPIEARSIEYAKAAGLVQQDTIKLLLTTMPGQSRVRDGVGMSRNTVLLGGKAVKYEPVYVFMKPF